MNPITAASASCNLLRSPLCSPIAPRKSSWSAPSIGQLGKTVLTVPSADRKGSSDGRRGSRDNREMFAYSDHKSDQTKKKKKLKFENTSAQHAQKQTKHSDAPGPQEVKKKKLKDVAKEVQQTQQLTKRKNTKKHSKDCTVM